VYIILAGHASFERDGEVVRVEAGDTIVVPAQMAHRFEDFSQDFATWVVFWGPMGGETDADRPQRTL
jgi:mannose-6-phosphate isomerase-like protein (cupin superfamily)